MKATFLNRLHFIRQFGYLLQEICLIYPGKSKNKMILIRKKPCIRNIAPDILVFQPVTDSTYQ